MDSFIKYFGGKSLLSDEIIQKIPPHKTYVEAFCGASWVLFSKPPSHFEVINDIDNQLVNLYLVVKNNPNRLIEWLKLIPISETLFNYFNYQEGIPPLEQESEYVLGIPEAAAKTYYKIMNSFNGKIASKSYFAFSKNKRSGFVRFYNTDWEKISLRLKEVTILNRDFKELIEFYNRPDTFFYFDPPYLCASKNDYKYNFKKKDHELLKVYLEDLEAKFILSYGNDKKIRELYKNFNITQSLNYPNELLITNYDIPKKPFYCRDGIPKTPGVTPRANWNIPNCPYCGSREIQQVSKRITIQEGKRNWVPCGYTCRGCRNLFRRSAQGIP